ncbi:MULTISPECIES: RNA polymerase sigma factor [unclassified Acinetobacter]|uniref:RNA polymerase sigma factor n=1 Tax=unclassified Acinetobacter TaxID=196816 RepID=UPI0035B867AB
MANFLSKTHDAALTESLASSLEQRLEQFMHSMSSRALVMMENACQGREDVAMDLVQEAFISLHQKYPHKPITEWYPLFYTILNNKLMDWRRREARRSQRFGWLKVNPLADEDSDTLENIVDEQQVDPSEQVIGSATNEEILQAIQALPVRQQQAFMLRTWEGFDTATTAKVMDCSEGSVKTHYHRAIQTLKQRLAHLDER